MYDLSPYHRLTLPVELNSILAHSAVLLTSLLNVTLARNWLAPSVYVMQLHARLVQAVKPSQVPATDYLQYPSIKPDEVQALSRAVKEYKKGPDVDTIEAIVKKLKADEDPRASIVAKAAQRWCRLDIVEASFTGMFQYPFLSRTAS
jgi:translocation protein SEC63